MNTHLLARVLAPAVDTFHGALLGARRASLVSVTAGVTSVPASEHPPARLGALAVGAFGLAHPARPPAGEQEPQKVNTCTCIYTNKIHPGTVQRALRVAGQRDSVESNNIDMIRLGD